MLQKISFLQKLKRWVVREEKELCSAGEGSSSTSVLLPSECSTPSGRNPSGCPTHSGCFETALSHEVLFKMMVMVLLLCLTIEPAMAVDSLGSGLEQGVDWSDVAVKGVLIAAVGAGVWTFARQGNILMIVCVIVSVALAGMMIGAIKDDSYTSLLG